MRARDAGAERDPADGEVGGRVAVKAEVDRVGVEQPDKQEIDGDIGTMVVGGAVSHEQFIGAVAR